MDGWSAVQICDLGNSAHVIAAQERKQKRSVIGERRTTKPLKSRDFKSGLGVIIYANGVHNFFYDFTVTHYSDHKKITAPQPRNTVI